MSARIHAHVGGSRVDAVTLREILLRIFHRDGKE